MRDARSQMHIVSKATNLARLELLRFGQAPQSQRTQSRATVRPDHPGSNEPMYLIHAPALEQTRGKPSTALDEDLGEPLARETAKSSREVE